MTRSGRAETSLRRRTILSYLGAGGGLLVILGLAAVWLYDAVEEASARLVEAREFALITSRFQSTVLRELEAGLRYVATGDPVQEQEFVERGIQAYALQERIVWGARSSELVLGMASLQEDLAVAEAALALAHRLVELGREAEANEAIARASERMDRVLSGLERQSEIRSRQQIALAERLRSAALWRGVGVLAAIVAGFGVAFVASQGTVRVVNRSTNRLLAHAQRLKQGDMDVRTDVRSLPPELRVLGVALNDASRSLAELAEKERVLMQAEKLSTVGLLVAGVAHELNNPLTTMLLTSEELGDEEDISPHVAEGLETIRRQSERARTIVEELLSTVREDQSFQGSVRPVPVIESLRPAVEARVREAGARLEWHIPADTSSVRGTAPALERVVTNLVDNAARAAGQGGVVGISVEEEGGVIRIQVTDDGPGVSPEVRPRIFDPFFTTRPTGEGVGLGLSVAQGLARSMGGSVRCATPPSHRGEGAVFEVELPGAQAPVTQGPGDDRGGGEDVVPESSVAAGPDATPRILIVDDEEALRRTLRRVFSRHGWRVETAADGREALELVRAAADDPFNVILSDLKMPVMSGMELVDRLVTDDPSIGRRLLVMTGEHVSPGPGEFVERTDVPVVGKPFDVAEIIGLVQRIARDAEEDA